MSPTRRPSEPPQVTIEVAPAYELLQSIAAVLESAESDAYDVGPEWFAAARARAGEDLLERIGAFAMGQSDTYYHLVGLAYDTPAPRDIPSFLEHLRQTDPHEIRLHLVQFYERETRRATPASVIRAAVAGDAEAQAEFLRASHPDSEPWTAYLRSVLSADGAAFKAELIAILEAWAERVWEPLSVTIMPILERDAAAKRELVGQLPTEQFVTAATNGVEFAPRPGISRLVLVPSFVNRPLVTYAEYGEVFLIVYPVADESVSAETDTPPLRLVRLSKALADEKRLRILRALSDGDRSLQELADMFGVAKTTMHHHMIILRSAGLITVAVGSKNYRLRHETVPDVGALLSGYLGAGPGPSVASGSPAPARRTASG